METINLFNSEKFEFSEDDYNAEEPVFSLSISSEINKFLTCN
jgi:hypothetical protein